MYNMDAFLMQKKQLFLLNLRNKLILFLDLKVA